MTRLSGERRGPLILGLVTETSDWLALAAARQREGEQAAGVADRSAEK
jgi:hypothetical protein